MSSRDAATTYHQATAVGASAVGQIVALYDAILRDLHRALAAGEGGQIETRVNNTNHALVIIGELQGVLDFERGGEAARNLSNFYNVMRAMVTHASMTNSREEFLELISHFARLRAAWSHVELSVAPAEPENRLRISSSEQPASSPTATRPAETLEEAGTGEWTA